MIYSVLTFLLVIAITRAFVLPDNMPMPKGFNPAMVVGLVAEINATYPGLTSQQQFEFANALLKVASAENATTIKQREFNPAHDLALNEKFNCTAYPPSVPPPTSVHALRPGDVKVVAALGDSISAGFGALARTIFGVFTEYRGVSYSIGGDDDFNTVYTLPNFLKVYNPNLVGFSTGTGGAASNNAQFNQAISGARANGIRNQAGRLLDRMKADSRVNFDNDWKVITIFIGGNDLCQGCNNEGTHTPEAYIGHWRETLTYIKENFPKTFVNVVLNVDVTRLTEVSAGLCGLLHNFECPCGTGSQDKRDWARNAYEKYNEALYDLVQEPALNDQEDFTAIIQPFLKDTEVPEEDGQSYFAPDCFHFSGKAHAAAAVALWNNIFEPVGGKDTEWRPHEDCRCPEINEFLNTRKNSGPGARN